MRRAHVPRRTTGRLGRWATLLKREGFQYVPPGEMARSRQQRSKGWWARQDSNLQPRDYESPALTVVLQARTVAAGRGF